MTKEFGVVISLWTFTAYVSSLLSPPITWSLLTRPRSGYGFVSFRFNQIQLIGASRVPASTDICILPFLRSSFSFVRVRTSDATLNSKSTKSPEHLIPRYKYQRLARPRRKTSHRPIRISRGMRPFARSFAAANSPLVLPSPFTSLLCLKLHRYLLRHHA